jgi:hypothetical protein
MENSLIHQDLDLPLHYDNTVRDCLLEQVRVLEPLKTQEYAVMNDATSCKRLEIVDRMKRDESLRIYTPLLNDIQIALMQPKTVNLVRIYMCVLHRICCRGRRTVDSDTTLRYIMHVYFNPTIEPEWTWSTYIRVLWRQSTKKCMDLYVRYVYERPWPLYRFWKLWTNPTMRADCETLCERGIVVLPQYVSGSVLKTIQSEFDTWCKSKSPDNKKTTKIDGGLNESYLSTSESLSSVAVDPYIRHIVDYYLGKPSSIAYTRGYRTEPVPHERYRAFQWHHDLKRKMIKVMLLLTDVAADGQRMDYAVGSHTIWHKFDSQRDTVFTDEYVESSGYPIVPACGKAGTVIIFDPNGYHTGNRNMTARRDQYTFNYTAGLAIFPVRLYKK